jgi:hypothetical protein
MEMILKFEKRKHVQKIVHQIAIFHEQWGNSDQQATCVG